MSHYYIYPRMFTFFQQSVIPRLWLTRNYYGHFTQSVIKLQCNPTSFKKCHTDICILKNERTFCSQAYRLDAVDNNETNSDEQISDKTSSFEKKKIRHDDDEEQIQRRIAHAESKISKRLMELASESQWTPETHWEETEEESYNDKGVKKEKQRYRFSQMEGYVPNKVDKVEKEPLLTPEVEDTVSTAVDSGTLKTDDRATGEISSLPNKYTEEAYKLVSSKRDISHIRPVRPSKSYNLAVYVRDSDTLSNLVKLGVDLSKIEQDPEIAGYIARLNWNEDVMPYINFLQDINVPAQFIATIFTKNPAIFRESLEDLQIRVNYFESKNFTMDAVGRIISDAPAVFSLSVKEIDKQLGFLQRQFTLSGDEVRYVVTRYPKLILKKQTFIEGVIMTLQEELGFTATDQKKLLLSWPKLFVIHVGPVSDTFEYLYNEMGLSHSDIMVWPNILTTRVHRIEERHKFLLLVDRAQYNPKKENFVSLKALATGTDSEFCANVAKVPVQQFNDYLKTI